MLSIIIAPSISRNAQEDGVAKLRRVVALREVIDPERSFVLAAANSGKEPIYQNPATPRMASITSEAKTFNNCMGFERGFW